MKVISHNSLITWLQLILRESNLYAPKYDEGILLYQFIEDTNEIIWENLQPANSIKEFFFPQTEKLMTIKLNGGKVGIDEILPKEKTVIFGVRPCDAQGLMVLDSMFIHTEPIDKYYASRRDNTVLIGMSCQEMGETCFCTSMGSTPDDPAGMDLMLTKVKSGYHVEVLTNAGNNLIEDLGFEEADIELPEKIINQEISVPDREKLLDAFNSALWADQSERCIDCRVCAYVCPTCRCFDLRDEKIPSQSDTGMIERIRSWDSCGGRNYRLIAGGHNPREKKAERLRNRIFCKLIYYPEQYGPIACTGCGRCIQACPSNIDITEIFNILILEDIR